MNAPHVNQSQPPKRAWQRRLSRPLLLGALGPLAVFATTSAGCGDDTVTPDTVCEPTGGLVSRVIDGDTIELETGEKVRYLLVDTPEIEKCTETSTDQCWETAAEDHECFGNEARELNRRLVQDREIEILYDANQCTDFFGRALGYVYVDDRMVNEILVERGYAKVLIENPENRTEAYEYAASFCALEARAFESAFGMWGVCPGEQPEEDECP